jgi:hypothetical protein
MRILPILVLVPAVLATAPARAQRSSDQPLREHVGTTVAYRVAIPARWDLKEDGEKLTATNGTLLLVLGAKDLMVGKRETTLPVSPAESRRILTNMFLGSDSLLLGMMDAVGKRITEEPGYRCSTLAREVRELAGQHAGFLSVRCDHGRGESARFDLWCTVKEGIVYFLMYGAEPKDYAVNEPLFDRIRGSLVLADAPPAGSPD